MDDLIKRLKADDAAHRETFAAIYQALRPADPDRATWPAEIARLREDAARWRAIRTQFAPLGLNMNGDHSWQWRGNPARLNGPTIDAAIDAALGKHDDDTAA